MRQSVIQDGLVSYVTLRHVEVIVVIMDHV